MTVKRTATRAFGLIPHRMPHFFLLSAGFIPLLFGQQPEAQPCVSPFNLAEASFASGSQWQVCWSDTPSSSGLWIGSAKFKKDSDAPWLSVLGPSNLAEIFVPYHALGNAFLRHAASQTADSEPFYGVYCFRAPQTSFPTTRKVNDYVCEEKGDRGLAWKNGPISRRGAELVLWGSNRDWQL